MPLSFGLYRYDVFFRRKHVINGGIDEPWTTQEELWHRHMHAIAVVTCDP